MPVVQKEPTGITESLRLTWSDGQRKSTRSTKVNASQRKSKKVNESHLPTTNVLQAVQYAIRFY